MYKLLEKKTVKARSHIHCTLRASALRAAPLVKHHHHGHHRHHHGRVAGEGRRVVEREKERKKYY